jgi:hypothetical protein
MLITCERHLWLDPTEYTGHWDRTGRARRCSKPRPLAAQSVRRRDRYPRPTPDRLGGLIRDTQVD